MRCHYTLRTYVRVRAAWFTVNAATYNLLSFTCVERLKFDFCILL